MSSGDRPPTVDSQDDVPPIRYAGRFFQKDPQTASKRSAYLKILGGGTMMTIIAIFSVLSIYWGALWKVNLKVNGLNGWVVDFDGGVMGSTVVETLMNITGSKEQISWSVVSASNFPNGPSDIVHAVVENQCWVAVTINPGASNALTSAIASVDSSYNGSQAITVYAAEARNENSYPEFLIPNVQIPLEMAAEQFAVRNSKKLATQTNLSTLLSTAPSVIIQPMYFTINNIRPFDVAVASAIDFVGLIYLLIIAFIISLMNYNARLMSGITYHLRMRSLILLRIAMPLAMYFILSLFYSLVSLAFLAPFDRRFGHAGFFIYWMLSWVAMSALGLAVEAVITLITARFVPFFLILWIITNVSVSYYPIEMLPNVFRYGYATPFYNVSQAVRTILFSTRNQLGLNFGVQFAWIGISCITITLFQTCIRRREEKQWRRQHLTEKEQA